MRIPTSLPFSTTGTPEILYLPIRASASNTLSCGERKNGLTITPFSERFTLSTSSTCCSMVMFLWIIPIPPSLAIAIAMRLSVTVSIAEVMIGVLSVMFLVSCVLRSIMFGVTSLFAGMSSTSSNVRPSLTNFSL